MKHFYFLTTFLLVAICAQSQKKIEVEIGQKNMSKGTQTAITVLIPEAKPNDVEPAWKKYVNNRSVGERIGNLATQVGNIFKSDDKQVNRDKLKVEKIGDELFVKSIEQAMITKHLMDIYARIIELPEGCQFNTFFQYTDSAFINETNADPEQIQNMKAYIRDFGVIVYQGVVDGQIKEAKKEVSKQEGVLKDLESDSKKEEKNITKLEVDIQETEAEIVGIESDIKRLDEKITAQKVTFSGLKKGTPEYDAGKSEQKDLAKEKSKCFSKIKSAKSKIKSKQMDIKSLQTKIAMNDAKINSQQTVIQAKEQMVQYLIQKKDAIQ
ncbi:MAG: hypothetical protein PHP53_03365 [Prolixibacteraceae bacterium]|nr:hypothetical protein [Prolixibacteraceae bacterium]